MTREPIVEKLPADANQHANPDNLNKLQPTPQEHAGTIKIFTEDRPSQFTVDVVELSGIVDIVDFAVILSAPLLIQRFPQHLHAVLKKAVSEAFDTAYHEAFGVISKYIFRQHIPWLKARLRNFLGTPDGVSREIDTRFYQNEIGVLRGNCEVRLQSVELVSERYRLIRDACESALLLSDEKVLAVLSPKECQALRDCLDAYLRPYLSDSPQSSH
jgi:hypothetical protein